MRAVSGSAGSDRHSEDGCWQPRSPGRPCPGASPATSVAATWATTRSPSGSWTWTRPSDPRKLTASTRAAAPSSAAQRHGLGAHERGHRAGLDRSLEQWHACPEDLDDPLPATPLQPIREPDELGHEGGRRAVVELGRRAICSSRPADMTPTRSPSASASSWSWVTNSVVVPTAIWMRRISSRSCRRTLASSAESGSSRRSTFGSIASARASATRCCWPPDIWYGYRSACFSSPTSSSIAPARLRRSSLPTPRSRSP